MAITTYQSRPGLGERLGEGLASGLGSAVGQGLGRGLVNLGGKGLDALGKLAGGSEDGSESIQFWVSQGYTPEEAQQIAKMPMQLQQEMLKQAGSRRKAEAIAPAYSQLLGVSPTKQMEGTPEEGQGEQMDPDKIEEDLIGRLIQAGATEKDFQELLKAQQAQKKISLSEEKGEIARHKALQPTMQKYSEEYKNALDGLHRIERMRELEKEDLAGRGEFLFLENIGDIPVVGKFIRSLTGPLALNPASQEYQKLSNEFMREMKSIFGGKVSNMEVEQFMKSIPTLANTKEGRKRIYKNLEYMYKAKKLPYKIAKEIKKEHGGKTPLDIDELVTERLGKKRKEMASKLKFNVPKELKDEAPLPQEQVTPQRNSVPMPYEGSMRNTLEDLFG